jgi:hypothetical protein
MKINIDSDIIDQLKSFIGPADKETLTSQINEIVRSYVDMVKVADDNKFEKDSRKVRVELN